MKKFLESVFFDRESWWGFWKAVIGSLVISVVLTTVIVLTVNAANQESIEACLKLGGDIVTRGFNCLLPTGEIVEPIRYLTRK